MQPGHRRHPNDPDDVRRRLLCDVEAMRPVERDALRTLLDAALARLPAAPAATPDPQPAD